MSNSCLNRMTAESQTTKQVPVLLQALASDLSDLDKRRLCIKDCLRSKSIPCPQVKHTFASWKKETIERLSNELIDSNRYVAEEYLGEIRRALKLVQQQNNNSCIQSTLHYVVKMAATFRYLQFSLKWICEQQSAVENAAMNGKCLVAPQDVNKSILLTVQLIQDITIECMNLLEERIGSTNGIFDDTTLGPLSDRPLDPLGIVYFIFGSILALNWYIESLPAFLVPLWKTICAIIATCDARKVPLPFELLNKAIFLLSGHVRAGLEATIDASHALCSCSSSCDNQQLNAALFNTKLLSFVVARLQVLFEHAANLLQAQEDGLNSIPSIWDVFDILFTLQGLSFIVSESVREIHNESAKKLQKSFIQLAARVSKCFKGLFVLPVQGDTSGKRVPNWEAIQKMTDFIVKDSDTKGDLELECLRRGKLNILVQIQTDVSKSKSERWKHDNVEAVLTMCQHLIFEFSPSIAREAVTSSDKNLESLVSELVRSSAKVLLQCCAAAISFVRGVESCEEAFHGVLLKWLVHASRSQNPCDPMAREVLISVFTLYLGESFAACGPQNYGKLSAYHLCEFLVSLSWDPRTAAPLRRIVVLILTRSVHSGAAGLSCSIRSLVSNSASKVSGCNMFNRKRKRSLRTYSAQDAAILFFMVREVNLSLRHEMALPQLPLSRPAIRNTTFAVGISGTRDQLTTAALIHIYMNQSEKSSDHCSRWMHLMGRTILHSFRDNAENHIDPELLQRFLETSAGTQRLQHSSEGCVALAIEALRTLGITARFILPSSPCLLAESVSKLLRSSLSSSWWALRSLGLSSVIEFASSLPTCHQHLIPTSIPRDLQKFLQNRLKRTSDLNFHNDALVRACRYPRRHAHQNRIIFGKATLKPSRISIPNGSFYLTMPTRDGRSAAIIFPPGESSLQDIRSLLSQDDEPPDIKSIIRAVTMRDGSCRLLLQ